MYALFAVLGIVIFFWLSFHQNGVSLSLFARDYVDTEKVAPEIWQAVNPFFVIVLTPLIMLLFGHLARRGKEISTPKKIRHRHGHCGNGIPLPRIVLLLARLSVGRRIQSDGCRHQRKHESRTVGSDRCLLLPHCGGIVHIAARIGIRFESSPKHLQGLCQGLWLGATALGNLFLWIGATMYDNWDIWQCWGMFLAVCVVSMSVMLGMVKWLEK